MSISGGRGGEGGRTLKSMNTFVRISLRDQYRKGLAEPSQVISDNIRPPKFASSTLRSYYLNRHVYFGMERIKKMERRATNKKRARGRGWLRVIWETTDLSLSLPSRPRRFFCGERAVEECLINASLFEVYHLRPLCINGGHSRY